MAPKFGKRRTARRAHYRSKKDKTAPLRRVKRKGKSEPRLWTMKMMDPLLFEPYFFTVRNDTDDHYTYDFMQYIDGNFGDINTDAFDELDFVSYVTRRSSPAVNEPLRGTRNGYVRCVFIRYPPGGISTPATRKAGLEGLKAFLLRFNTFPHQKITTVDKTVPGSYPALDEFLLNDQIDWFLTQATFEHERSSGFFDAFPEFARKCWSGNTISPLASRLGFPQPTRPDRPMFMPGYISKKQSRKPCPMPAIIPDYLSGED